MKIESNLLSTWMYLTLALPVLISCRYEGERNDERPNIILIMADDMGFSDLGFFGSQIETPNLDELAKNGLVFNQFYNTSRCCPSRAALLTGLYQHQAGVGAMVNDLGHPGYRGYLNDQCVTIAEVLKTAGYQTMMSGKWHLGSKPEHWPTKRGFDKFYGIPEGGGVYFYPFAKKRNVVLNDQVLEPDSSFYSTYAFNHHAVEFLKEAEKERKPFFLYLPHIAPHFPIQAPRHEYQKYLGKFRDDFQVLRQRRYRAMKQKGILPESVTLSASDEHVLLWDQLTESQKDTFDLKMAIYAAQLEIMDRGIGKIIQQLKEMGQFENTIIFFLSDNGGTHENIARKYAHLNGELGTINSYRAYGRSWAHVSNTPFRMYKHWVHEGGISSPLIVHYPSAIKHHRVESAITHIMDIMPTCVELARAPYPPTFEGRKILAMEGKSLVGLIRNQPWQDRETLFWEHEGNRAARSGKWKIVSAYPENKWRLYDMEHDRAESADLSDGNQEIKDALIAEYEAWATRAGVVPRDQLVKK